jgi:glucose 1-dehydrogenase
MLLEQKTIVVTGGNTGIGEAISRRAAAEGANLVVGYVEASDAARVLVRQITGSGGNAMAVRADVRSVSDIQKLVDAAVDSFGSLDVMINNAGIQTLSDLLQTTESEFDRTIEVNLRGAFFGTQLAARQFIAQKSPGVVINISSVHEEWPMPGNVAYCVAKGGIRMLARTAGVELGAHGIRVVNVAPGAVATRLTAGLADDAEARESVESSIPLGRIATPDDIADVVVFVASDAARYLTATTVFADGGMMQGGGSAR